MRIALALLAISLLCDVAAAQAGCLASQPDAASPVVNTGSYTSPPYPFAFTVTGIWTPIYAKNGTCPDGGWEFKFTWEVTITADHQVPLLLCVATPASPPSGCWDLTPTSVTTSGSAVSTTFGVPNFVMGQACGASLDWVIQFAKTPFAPFELSRLHLTCTGC